MSMKRCPELRPTVWDGCVVLAVVLLAAGCLAALGRGTDERGLTAVVTADGREIDRFPLTALLESPRTYESNGFTLEVTAARNGSISPLDAQPSGGAMGLRVLRADCPTQDCVRTGAIFRSGQSVICLPARMILRLEGGSPDGSGPDVVIG